MTDAARAARFPDLKTVLALSRVSNLPTVWMNVLTAALLSGEATYATVVLLAASLSAFYCGGMVLNDLFDRSIDAREQPFRPIPAGRASVEQARLLATLLLGAGLALLCLAPHRSALLPGLVLLAMIWAYDRWHKGHPSSVLLMAGTRFMVFVVTASAIAGSVSGIVLFAGLLQLLYTLLVTVVARYENSRGERYSFPLIPWMLSAMPIVDGVVLAIVANGWWLLVGLLAAALTRFGQRYVRGD